MRFIFSLLLLVAAMVNAASVIEGRSGCLTDAQAKKLISILVATAVKFNISDVEPYYADNYIGQSDSLAFLFGNPPGTPGANKTTYLQTFYNITTSSPQPPIKVLDYFYNCHQIAFHWISLIKPENTRGVDMVWVNPNKLQIERDVSEFNVGAELVDEKLYPCANTTA